jgi:amino acid transporter
VLALCGLLYGLASTQPNNAFALSLGVIGGICILFLFYVYIEFTYFHHTKELSGIEYHQPATAVVEAKKDGEVLL